MGAIIEKAKGQAKAIVAAAVPQVVALLSELATDTSIWWQAAVASVLGYVSVYLTKNKG